MKRTLLALGIACAVLVGCNEGQLPAPTPTATPSATAITIATPTATPFTVATTPTPAPSATPFVLQMALALGPPADPTLPIYSSPTADPTPALQAIARRNVPTVKFIPPLPHAELPQSIVTANDSGGQAGTRNSGWAASGPIRGCYALLSLRSDVTLIPDPNGGLTTMYGPTMKCPNMPAEASVDYWAQAAANGGGMTPALRFFDFTFNSFAATSYDLRDPDFLGRFARDFGLGHGPQIELVWAGNSIWATDYSATPPVRVPLYTSPGGVTSRSDGWLLLPETHYPAGIGCSPLPPLYADNVQEFETYYPPASWSTSSADLAVSTYSAGDCFTAAGPGAYYETTFPNWPSFSAVQERSIGP